MTEQQITKEILRYLKDQSYNYAVLIDGEWGSGKTYFVNNTLIPLISEQEGQSSIERSIKYISLYGCKCIEDVQENIAWSFAENARAKIQDKANWGKTGETVSGNMLLSSKKIGNAILKKFLPETSLFEIASDWLNLGSFIFVFDDLERCDCSLNEVFGFLNELVEHENTKVIIIANEAELSGIADVQYLELQYSLTLDDRIEWPKPEQASIWERNNRNSKQITLHEMERRRGLLFPEKEANSSYRRIREKLIGVSLKYTPDIVAIISEIIKNSAYDDNTKALLGERIESYASTMKYYHHNNLRTFQFFISKVSYFLEQLRDIGIDEEYRREISLRIIDETFTQAIKFKSNYQPPRDNWTWLSKEQETSFQSIKLYVETGSFCDESFEHDVLKLNAELKANIPNDDPYYLVYQQYYFHTQEWCEEQLGKIIEQLINNRYPISFYGKIIVAIQRLVDLGFNEDYMRRATVQMKINISNMGEVAQIDPDLWFVEDQGFKDKVSDIITELNDAIKDHSESASRETVVEILEHENWIDLLEKYVNPRKTQYIQDTPLFSRADTEQWLKVFDEASPEEVDDFRHLLGEVYPRNVVRMSYLIDASTMKEIVDRLDCLKKEDLIKKACLGWLKYQFGTIIRFHEPEAKEHSEEE